MKQAIKWVLRISGVLLILLSFFELIPEEVPDLDDEEDILI